MSIATTVLTTLTPVLPQIVTGLFTIAGAIGGVRLTQRFTERTAERQRARDKKSAANAEVKAVTQELFAAVSQLRLDLAGHQPTHNAWGPRLLMIGMSVLEVAAAREGGRYAAGLVRAGQIAVDADQRGIGAAMALRGPLQRVMDVVAQAALLPAGDVREAALYVGEAAAEFATAYGKDGLWQPKRARKAREAADAVLLSALAALVDSVGNHLHPVEEEPPTRSRVWLLNRRRRNLAPPTSAELPAAPNAPAMPSNPVN